MNVKEILDLIKNVTLAHGFIMTGHASQQAISRRMRTGDIRDILLNADRVIRKDIGKFGDTIYKIKGGSKNRSLAVCVIKDCVIIITVM